MVHYLMQPRAPLPGWTRADGRRFDMEREPLKRDHENDKKAYVTPFCVLLSDCVCHSGP